ncbi:EcoKI restriction-modification system protein HsdS [Limihaloglobus sulfuriphilus]|uniref:EcoKI restriction-modification system protein HsdS n=1 Tax=Limihaloglobus sulfuriphilus TaxID=1851148 RepID=A0A1Q2MET7_9BACT|nr:restriction endonuclease subunit S [Limihaloglobus sulfuriphilus]AQQ71169.1 EcoKI restriction-modification system protein HsdS [Limihaloglobus sulfuriphilus]
MLKYPEYKDSGVEWIGDIPSHWSAWRLKYIFDEVDIRKGDKQLPLLGITKAKGIVLRGEIESRASVSDSYEKYKVCNTNDIVMNKMQAWNGIFGISQYHGIVSPDYAVFKKIIDINVRYFHYLLRTDLYASLFRLKCRGMGTAFLRLNSPDFFDCIGLLPPLPEQQAIADFLDDKTGKIDMLISTKRRQIELLKEQRTAVINQAVTRGLDPDVELKDSGIEWLGQIPKHWGIKRLKFLTTINTGDKDTVNNIENGEYPFFVRSQTIERINSYTYDGEAVLTAGDGVGVAKVFHYINGKFDYHQRVYKFSDFKDIVGKFFFHYMKANLYKEVIKISAKSTVDSLRMPMLQNFVFALPPIEEQNCICAYIEETTQEIDKTITKAQKQIELLTEYRTGLISEAVTGKICVSEQLAVNSGKGEM